MTSARHGSLLAMILTFATGTLGAQPGARAATQKRPADPDEAKARYQQHLANGIKLFKEQQWDGAIAEFEAAYKVWPGPSPLINLALTYKKTSNPARAIEVLRQALDKHEATMPEDQRAAAKREIEEMTALLAYVSVRVRPAHAKLFIDGQRQPQSTVLLPLSPGMRHFRAEAAGYESVERTVQVTSGRDNPPLALELKAVAGRVAVRATLTDSSIEIDGKSVGRGAWQGRLPAGVHAVVIKREGKAEHLNIVVVAGASHEVTQEKNGALQSDAAAPDQEPQPKLGLPSDMGILRGLYGQASVGSLTVFFNADGFEPTGADRFGVALAGHLGYRVTSWAAFEGFAQFSDLRVEGTLDEARTGTSKRDATFKLRSGRLGLLLRIMLPASSAFRFVGTFGLGGSIDELEWQMAGGAVLQRFGNVGGAFGVFGTADLGVEFEYNNLLFDVMFQHTLMSSKQFDTNGENAFDTRPLLIHGPLLRVGYGLW